jgi:predicted Fe-S protein YdhL (DUF1289 family)
MINPSSIEMQSPCVRNCCLDDKDMCLGCFRVIDEILIWGQADDTQKREILVLCEARKKNSINSRSF